MNEGLSKAEGLDLWKMNAVQGADEASPGWVHNSTYGFRHILGELNILAINVE